MYFNRNDDAFDPVNTKMIKPQLKLEIKHIDAPKISQKLLDYQQQVLKDINDRIHISLQIPSYLGKSIDQQDALIYATNAANNNYATNWTLPTHAADLRIKMSTTTKKKRPKKLRPLFKCHGGKYYLSDWIISEFPDEYEEYNYIEPFIGGGSVFLNKKPATYGRIEVINDRDFGIYCVWKAVQDHNTLFSNQLSNIKYAKNTFTYYVQLIDSLKHKIQSYIDTNDTPDLMDCYNLATAEYIVRRMSRGGLKKSFAWSDRLRGGIPGDVNAWNTAIRQLQYINERLNQRKNIVVQNKSAIDTIRSFDYTNSLVYCDPPYLHETRISKAAYEHEMSDRDHEELADTLNNIHSKALISGYRSKLYDKLYRGWNMVEKTIKNHSSQQKVKQNKVEVLWKNY